ncbi:MAG: hypothetical protein V3S76_01225 [Candidatus Bipolaricaulota bacterium]
MASRYTAEYTQESIFFIPLTAEDAEEEESRGEGVQGSGGEEADLGLRGRRGDQEQGENKGAEYVSLAILGGLSE